ncbi:MAG: UDP-3-O-(3-hydroxymyristoyl)glucosamine N-acyltransferase [Bacteroidales bacterium]|jgi:UDP-3-O-[3-hydroxymyristoyl] glucosamine N-acyltransferase|nr:UDP-3-O-(3-hydroxymyristoyl)glucosamine N-acyltransferase [Bacteroidales bacterium]
MEFSAAQIAEMIHGQVDGRPDVMVSKLSGIEEGSEGCLSFLSNPLYISHLYTTQASVVIVNADFIPDKPLGCTLIRVENAYMAFARLLQIFDGNRHDHNGISALSSIHETASIGKDVYIAEFVCVGRNSRIGDNAKLYPNVFVGDNVTVGDNTKLYPGVKVYDSCELGSNCTLHSGVIVGGDGFGFAPYDGSYRKLAQIGNVIIEDYVEIGANTTIDRATMGSTIIRKGVKLDNLIQVAHNVEIGENTVIAAQSGISGSTKIGRNCMIGGQVGIIGHITIADDVKIAAQSGIGASITQKGAVVQGSPAFEIQKYKRSYVHFRKLHDLVLRIQELEKKQNS